MLLHYTTFHWNTVKVKAQSNWAAPFTAVPDELVSRKHKQTFALPMLHIRKSANGLCGLYAYHAQIVIQKVICCLSIIVQFLTLSPNLSHYTVNCDSSLYFNDYWTDFFMDGKQILGSYLMEFWKVIEYLSS